MRRLLAALVTVLALMAPVTSQTGAADPPLYHRVTRGQTLSRIAAYYGVPLPALVSANRIRNPNFIYVGQRLIIPTVARYKVVRGDTLAKIARRYHTSWIYIARANRIRNPNLIYAGQWLYIPGVPPATPPTLPTPTRTATPTLAAVPASPTPTLTASPTGAPPTASPSPTATLAPSATPTATPTSTTSPPTASPTPQPATATATSTATRAASATATPAAAASPTPIGGLGAPLASCTGVSFLHAGDVWCAEPGASPVQLTHDGRVIQFAWSPDGNALVYVAQAADSPQLFLIRQDGSAPEELGPGMDPAWSPDGSYITFRQGDHIWLMASDLSESIRLTQQSGWAWGNPVFAPDGRHVLAAGADKAQMDAYGNASFFFYTFPITVGASLTPLPGMTRAEEGRLPDNLRFSPDGTRLAYYTSFQGSPCFIPGDYRVLQADGSGARSLVPDVVWSQITTDTERFMGGGSFAWSPDGSRVVLTAAIYQCEGSGAEARATEVVSRTTYVVEPNGMLIRSWVGLGEEYAWSPDGQRLAYVVRAAGEEEGIVYISDPQGANAVALGPGKAPAWRP